MITGEDIAIMMCDGDERWKPSLIAAVEEKFGQRKAAKPRKTIEEMELEDERRQDR
jgi:hypothetical protein